MVPESTAANVKKPFVDNNQKRVIFIHISYTLEVTPAKLISIPSRIAQTANH
jgi:hypothetical protein